MLHWMYWTWQSAVGFGSLILTLVVLGFLEGAWPSGVRRGLLPMATTRGDRVFLSVAFFLALVFGWLKFMPETSAWAVSGFGAPSAAAILRLA
jgi:predicted small integral membrane protein